MCTETSRNLGVRWRLRIKSSLKKISCEGWEWIYLAQRKTERLALVKGKMKIIFMFIPYIFIN